MSESYRVRVDAYFEPKLSRWLWLAEREPEAGS